MEKNTKQPPIERLIEAGLDEIFISQTAKTFDHWRQTLTTIDDQDLGQDDLNTIYKRHAQS